MGRNLYIKHTCRKPLIEENNICLWKQRLVFKPPFNNSKDNKLLSDSYLEIPTEFVAQLVYFNKNKENNCIAVVIKTPPLINTIANKPPT